MILCADRGGDGYVGQGLFGLSDQLKRLSDCGDALETMSRVVDFEVLRPVLEKALADGDGVKGGRPPYDPVAMFKSPPREEAIEAGRNAAEIWPNQPAKAAQKDTDARWTLKFAKARVLPDGRPGIDIAIPSFGYKSSIAICRRYGFIRRGKVTDGARFNGRMLRDVMTNDNTASDVRVDTAYRSRSNEAWLKSIGRVSRVHPKKPKGKPMSARTARANLAYDMDRLVFHERRAAMG